MAASPLPASRSLESVAGVIFDLDGTLAQSDLDFAAIRAEVGAHPDRGVLEQMDDLPEAERQRWDAVLDRHEQAGAERALPYPGASDWQRALDRREIPRAIFTRNRQSVALTTLQNCELVFDDVLGRDDGPPKPDPTLIHDLADRWRCSANDLLLIGDWIYDVQAGRRAGTQTALVTRGRALPFAHQADHVWTSLETGLMLFEHHLSQPGPDITTIGVALVRQDHRWLVGTRQPNQTLAGKAEFPGGKVLPSETPAQAAQRECLEETGLTISLTRRLYQCQHAYPFGWLDLHFFEATSTKASPNLVPKPPFAWVEKDQLKNLHFPPANNQVLELMEKL